MLGRKKSQATKLQQRASKQTRDSTAAVQACSLGFCVYDSNCRSLRAWSTDGKLAGAGDLNALWGVSYSWPEKLVVTKLCGAIPIYQNARPWLVASKIGGVTPNGVLDAGTAGNWCAECWYVKKT